METRILIFEKYTSYEIVSKNRRKLKTISEKRLKDLKKSHEDHIIVRKDFLAKLRKNKIHFKILKDTHRLKVNCDKYDFIVSLGGDGTFLHAASVVRETPIIGINTDIKKSKGFLTKFNYRNIDKIVELMISRKYETQVWTRLCSSINGKKIKHLALNEILIGNPNIYSTSHLRVDVNGNIGDFIGNGIVISTKKGSTAFYKSSGGIPFKTDSFGYSIILPFKCSGKVEKHCILDRENKIIIYPKRREYKLLFDCDEKRAIKLKQEDKVEIGIDFDDGLKVIV